MKSACRICELNASEAALPLRERLYVNDTWRVAHGWSSLPGWLVVALRRHAGALDDLTEGEAAALGPILRAASAALRRVVRCDKTYVMLFAEHPLYLHLPLHVVPRMPWFDDGDRATAAFWFLDVPEKAQVPPEERERLAEEIGQTMREILGEPDTGPAAPLS